MMNNSAAAFSYYAIVQNQVLANLGLTLTMFIVAIILYRRIALVIFADYFRAES